VRLEEHRPREMVLGRVVDVEEHGEEGSVLRLVLQFET
jgi:hypothetical protein